MGREEEHMSTESGERTERTVVQAYVPKYQRDQWDEHASELDMSRSEFVKAMVQAGRRGFGTQYPDDQNSTGVTTDGNPKGKGDLEKTVIQLLEADSSLSWEELLEAVTGDIESNLDEILQDLQQQNRIRYSGRNGGYVLEEAPE